MSEKKCQQTANQACVPVSRDLEHGKTYYTIVWAYNGAITQQKVVNISNGGID
jgi:hypothetical protein